MKRRPPDARAGHQISSRQVQGNTIQTFLRILDDDVNLLWLRRDLAPTVHSDWLG